MINDENKPNKPYSNPLSKGKPWKNSGVPLKKSDTDPDKKVKDTVKEASKDVGQSIGTGTWRPKEGDASPPVEVSSAIDIPKNPVSKLPPWTGAYEALKERGLLRHGAQISMKFLSDILGAPNTPTGGEQLNLLVYALDQQGLHLQQRKHVYEIIPLEKSEKQRAVYSKKAIRYHVRAIVFGKAVLHHYGSQLSDSAKRRQAKAIEREELRLLFCCSPEMAAKALRDLPEQTLDKMKKKADKQIESASGDSSDIGTEPGEV